MFFCLKNLSSLDYFVMIEGIIKKQREIFFACERRNDNFAGEINKFINL